MQIYENFLTYRLRKISWLQIWRNYSILNYERHDVSACSVASEALPGWGNAVSGIWIESGTTADRITRIEESAKHRVSDSLSGLLRCTCQVYLPLRVLTPLPSFVIWAVAPLSVSSSPRAETVMCLLPSSGAYHRLAFSGPDNSISISILRNFHSDYVAVCFHRSGVVAPVIV